MIGGCLGHGDSLHNELLHQGLASGVLLSLEGDDFLITSSKLLPVGGLAGINGLNLFFCKALYRVGRIDHENQGIPAYGLHLQAAVFLNVFFGLFRGFIGKDQITAAADELPVGGICLIVTDCLHGGFLILSGGRLKEGIGEGEGRSRSVHLRILICRDVGAGIGENRGCPGSGIKSAGFFRLCTGLNCCLTRGLNCFLTHCGFGCCFCPGAYTALGGGSTFCNCIITALRGGLSRRRRIPASSQYERSSQYE